VIELSAARPQDALVIARVHVASWQTAYVGMIPDDCLASLSVDERAGGWREILAQSATEVWIAREASECAPGRRDHNPGRREVLGFVSFGAYRTSEPVEERVGEISSLYVSPTHWGRGIGAALWLRARERLAAANYRIVALWVLADNVRAIRFYRAVGFREEPGSTSEIVVGGHPLRHVRYSLSLDVSTAIRP
jgi:ribosomal protein S18 acetylase RimI-like enzyme